MQQAVPGSVDPQPRDRSTKFVQVYKFWCYYWGLCLLTEPSGTRGGLFELLFLSLLFSALSLSYLYRFYSLSLRFHLFLPLPRLLSYLFASFSSVFILFFLPLIGLHLFGSPFNSTALPFRVPFFPPRPRILTPPLTCLFSLASSSVC